MRGECGVVYWVEFACARQRVMAINGGDGGTARASSHRQRSMEQWLKWEILMVRVFYHSKKIWGEKLRSINA